MCVLEDFVVSVSILSPLELFLAVMLCIFVYGTFVLRRQHVVKVELAHCSLIGAQISSKGSVHEAWGKEGQQVHRGGKEDQLGVLKMKRIRLVLA